MNDPVLLTREGAVLRLVLNAPERLNALTGPMQAGLMAGLHQAANDPAIRAVLLTGAGRAFCAGQDLREVTVGQDLGETLETRFNPLIRAVRGLPKPVVCAVNGTAAGAGANLALAGDVVLAAEGARFIQAFIRIGLLPDAGGTWLLPRLAGDARARGMAMLGEPVSAAQAAAWGMIWQAVPDAELDAAAARVAATLAALPAEGLRLIKQALDASGANTLDRQLDLERDLQRQAGRTADFAEGVQAFLDKRPARFA